MALQLTPAPELARESKLFGKYPNLSEFVSAVLYDDGTPRKPGYWTFRNRGASYEVTLYDFDSGSRLPVNGATFDEVFQAVEKLLAAPEAPWVPDDYLLGLLAKVTPRKRKK